MDEELQVALYELLSGDAALTAAAPGGVRDSVRAGTQFPYVVIDELIGSNDDTKDDDGIQFVAHIHVLSRHEGKREARNLQGHVYRVLQDADQAVTAKLANYVCVYCLFDGAEAFTEEDGLTRHGVSRFRISLREKP